MKTQLSYLKEILLIFVVLFQSCQKTPAPNSPESVGLQVNNALVFEGEKIIDNHTVRYSVKETKEMVFEVLVDIDTKQLQSTVDYQKQSIDYKNEGVLLSKEDKEVLLELGDALSRVIFKSGMADDMTMLHYTLLRSLEYWSKAPEGYSYKTRSIGGVEEGESLKSRDEGITCIRKNTFVNAEYDNAAGRNFSDRVRVNSSNCLGRCGAGCSEFFSLGSAWTKDCLDHDRCGRVLGGSTNPLDRNCGDEYEEAADDFLFGLIRGCRG